MNATLRRTVADVAIPYENGQPVEASVTTDEAGAWRVQWNFEGGRRRELFGPAYELRDALDVCQAINARAWA